MEYNHTVQGGAGLVCRLASHVRARCSRQEARAAHRQCARRDGDVAAVTAMSVSLSRSKALWRTLRPEVELLCG